MPTRTYIFLRQTLLCLLITFSAFAAERTNLMHMPFSVLQKIISIELEPQRLKARHNKANTLTYIKANTDINQVKHIRLQQKYLGIPVFAGHAILHKMQNTVLTINGSIYQQLENDLGTTPPYSLNIETQMLNKFSAKWQAKNISERHATPIIYVDKNNRANWAYKLQLNINHPDAIPERPTAIVNINTQETYAHWDDIKTSRNIVKGLGFGGNQKVGLYKYGNNLPFLDISHDSFQGVCYMENQATKIVDMNFSYQSANVPMAFTCPYSASTNAYWTGYNEDGYDNVNGSYSVSNDALYIASTIKQMYKKAYGVEALTDRKRPQQLIMRIHYGKNFANAFWDGKQMTFGDGNMYIHPLVSLSIGAHEVSHGFTEQNSNLAYFGQSGAINESFSDMAAQAAEYFVFKKNSWRIGQDVLKSSSPMVAIRFMEHPSLDRHSIEYAHQFREGMDVHYSSGVFNRLFYLLATSPKWNTQKAFKVMLKANMDYWTPSSSFSEAACGIIYATEDLNYTARDVKKVLDEVMIDYDLC